MRLYTLPATTTFADTYGSGAYGTGVYECENADRTQCVAGAGTGTAAGGNNGGASLTDTGVMVGLVVGVASLLLLVVVLVRFWRRPARLAAQPADTRAEEPQHPSRQD